MIGGSLALYKKLRRHERKRKEEPSQDASAQRKVLVVDPSYELFHHQRTIHEQYHHESPSPDCAICSSNGSLRPASSVASRFSGCSSTWQNRTERLSHTPSIASSHSGYGATLSSPDSDFNSPFEVRASDTFSSASYSQADDRAYSRSTTDLHRPTSPWVSRLNTQRHASVTELETPPSYDYATSTQPRSARPCDFTPRATLDAPFSTSDPLEAFELSSCNDDSDRSPAVRSNSGSSWSTSPVETRSPTDLSAIHNHTHTHQNNLAPIAESELQDLGLGHRDDLIKQGFLL